MSSPVAEAIAHILRELEEQENPAQQARVGSTVTFKNGETGVIKSITPDGTVDYE